MFSRTFEYPGYDGKMHKETWWFNLSEDELYKMELTNLGGMNGVMNRLMRQEKPKEIVDMFESIILGSVGERSIDGRKFMKKKRHPGDLWGEVAEDFRETQAYSQLFIELVSSGEKLAEFLKGAIPEEVARKLAEVEARGSDETKEAEKKPELSVVPSEEVTDVAGH